MKLWGKAAVLALLAGLAAPAFAQPFEPAPSSSEVPVTPPPADDGTRVINGDPVADGEAPWIGRMAADRKVTCGLLQSRIAQRGAAANFALRATNTSSARCLAAGADLQEVLSPDEKWIFTHQCGATYLGGGWLVTAAHCFKNAGSLPVAGSPTEALLFSAWQFSFGSNSATAKVPAYRADQIVVHAGYESVRVNPNTDDIGLSNDIALVHLENAIALDRNPRVRAIEIARPGKGLGTQAAMTVLMGWGSTTAQAWTEEGRKIDRLPEKLLKATLSIHDDCNESSPNPEARNYYARNPAPKGTICARGLAVGGRPTDSCHGDSGGPLIQANLGGTRSLASSDRAAGWYLVGIVSRGPGCGMPGASGLYTRVSSFADWIDRVRKGNWPRKTITRVP